MASVGGVATVDHQFRTVHERGFVRSKEQNYLRHLNRLARPVVERSAHDRLAGLGVTVEQILGHGRVDDTGMDRVHTNTELDQIDRAGFRQKPDSPF